MSQLKKDIEKARQKALSSKPYGNSVTMDNNSVTYDFRNDPAYLDALAKYGSHPLVNNLKTMASLQGSASLSAAQSFSRFLGGSPLNNMAANAYDRYRSELANVIQQMEAASYNNEQNTAAREAAAGYNPDLNSPSGSPVEDVEQPVPEMSRDTDNGGFVESFTNNLLGGISTVFGLVSQLKSIESQGLDNGLSELAIQTRSRDAVLDTVLDAMPITHDNVPTLLDAALGTGKIEGSDKIFDSIVASGITALEKSPYTSRAVRSAIRRNKSRLNSKSSTVRAAFAKRLKEFSENSYDAAKVQSRPDFEDDFGRMVSKVAKLSNKYFPDIIEYEQKMRELEIKGMQNANKKSAAEANIAENSSRVSDVTSRNAIDAENVTYRHEDGSVRSLGFLRGLSEAEVKMYEAYKAKRAAAENAFFDSWLKSSGNSFVDNLMNLLVTRLRSLTYDQ